MFVCLLSTFPLRSSFLPTQFYFCIPSAVLHQLEEQSRVCAEVIRGYVTSPALHQPHHMTPKKCLIELSTSEGVNLRYFSGFLTLKPE